MANTLLLNAQMADTKLSHVHTIGQILMEVARVSERAATLIEQDLTVPEMSLENCGKALKEYARKHQEDGCWACAASSLDPENPALKVILDFYKIPSAWVFEAENAPPSSPKAGVINLMDLL